MFLFLKFLGHTCHWELLTCWPSPQNPWSPATVLCHFLPRFLSYFLLCSLPTLPVPINFISIQISLHLFPTALSDWATEALYGQTHPEKYVPDEGFSVFDLWLAFYYLSISSNFPPSPQYHNSTLVVLRHTPTIIALVRIKGWVFCSWPQSVTWPVQPHPSNSPELLSLKSTGHLDLLKKTNPLKTWRVPRARECQSHLISFALFNVTAILLGGQYSHLEMKKLRLRGVK